MAKKKKILTNLHLKRFVGDMVLVVAKDDSEAEAIMAELQEYGVPYILGELPQMKDGKVIGCHKQITVVDGKKLKDILHKKTKA